MFKKILFVVFIILNVYGNAQELKISGTVQDTSAKTGLQNALTMVIRLNDSTLVGYGRSDKEGKFEISKMPIDTFIVIISHPQFADQTYIVVGSNKQTEFDFGKIVLPPKTNTLNEVVILAYRDKVYYKGDTLMFTADSFKLKQNATVEDLLKKLPGVQVDSKGKIKVQGKEVNQVLVDGDEFFGADPTIATKNLNANTVETVQVYEKKNENTESSDETVKVMNLKLKDEAKKGYFGKISGAGGSGVSTASNTPFYEGEMLANRFKKNMKLSVFGLGANSPRSRFNWDDIFAYGLNSEYESQSDDDGEMIWYSYDEQGGIPQTLKSGFYYNDKYGKKTKLNMDYTYGNNELTTLGSTNTQFFLNDTTYSNAQSTTSKSANQLHSFNAHIIQNLDSLTELIITPKVKIVSGNSERTQTDDFLSEESALTRQTFVKNTGKNSNTDLSGNIKLNKKFKKKDRFLYASYTYNNSDGENTGFLYSQNTYFSSMLPTSVTDQKKTSNTSKEDHQVTVSYTEPLSPKFKIEASYDFTNFSSLNNKSTKDYSGTAYDLENIALSNNFKNTRQVNRAGLKLIYEVKKYRIMIGSRARQVNMSSYNITTQKNLSQRVDNILPMATLRWRFGQNASLNLDYTTNSQQPDLTQLQPVIDNTNPNRISLGNPDLKPTFDQRINLNFYSFKPISNQNFWGGGSFSMNSNAIVYTTTYDSLGFATSKPVNVNGNYDSWLYLGFRRPIFNGLIIVGPNLGGGYSNDVSYINDKQTNTTNSNVNGRLSLSHEGDKLQVDVSASYSYNQPSSSISLQSNKPYSNYELSGEIEYKLPKKFTIATDANYVNNGQRAAGYNLTYVIWNASLSKMFLKNDNLIISVNAFDILNQNISTRRNVMDNRIVDTKSQVIRQYFLLRVTFKFNSNKGKQDEEEF